MPMRKTGLLCKEHGGNCHPGDAAWACDICAIVGLAKCKCGGNARGFGEACFSYVGCELCDEMISGVGIDAKKLWNLGLRDRYINETCYEHPTG